MIKVVGMLLFLLIIFNYNNAIAGEDNYYVDHAKGWHWYDDPKEEAREEDLKNSDPIEEMNSVRATIQRSLDKAVLHPTEDNIKDYLTLQNQYMNQSKTFSNAWKAVLLENPSLDFSLIHPTNNMARQVESDQTNEEEEKAIKALAKQSGLFFFYRSCCPYCQRFAPIVKHFSEQYDITVIAITTDGVTLPEFSDSLIDQGQSQKFNVTMEPALFAVNPYTQKAYPIGYGLMSEADLKKRILDIATHFKGTME